MVEVVLKFIVEPAGFVDHRVIAVEAHLNDDLVLQMTHVAVAEHADATPRRWAHLLRRHDDARLLAQLPHRGVDMRFPGIKATAGQLPPRAELRGGDLARMEEQDAVPAIARHNAHDVALNDGASLPGLKGSSQHRVIGERTVASETTRRGSGVVRRAAVVAEVEPVGRGRSGDSRARGRCGDPRCC